MADPSHEHALDTDANLLFGVLTLQADLIDAARFVEACTLWSTRKDAALADLLVERGWITADDRSEVENLLQRKLRKHGGNADIGEEACVQEYAAVDQRDEPR